MDCARQGRGCHQTVGIEKNMSELEQTKYSAIDSLKRLCARCHDGLIHDCRIQTLIQEIENLSGIPVKVNDRLYHVVFN